MEPHEIIALFQGLWLALGMRQIHAPDSRLHSVPADLDQFWVVTIISNPERFKRRFELYFRFAEMCEHAGVKLITVEQAFGDRQFMLTSPNNPFHLQVRSIEQLWIKENLINLGVKHACAIAPTLGLKVREIAWIDADCRPARTYRDWFDETWHQLQHFEFVQMWEYMLDLDYDHNPLGMPQPSFMANYLKFGTPTPEEFSKQYKDGVSYPSTMSSQSLGRPGLCWAANVSAFNQVGGIPDFCILGAGDYYMAHGLIGTINLATNEYIKGKSNTRYANKLFEWQERALYWIKKDVGFVPGLVFHDFHGNKVNRQYGTRGKILRNNKYNPDTDIKYDSFGQLQLETRDDRQVKLRDEIRGYFRARNEDQRP